jgi:hypothetical protein
MKCMGITSNAIHFIKKVWICFLDSFGFFSFPNQIIFGVVWLVQKPKISWEIMLKGEGGIDNNPNDWMMTYLYL